MFVSVFFDLLFIFRIALWPSAGKDPLELLHFNVLNWLNVKIVQFHVIPNIVLCWNFITVVYDREPGVRSGIHLKYTMVLVFRCPSQGTCLYKLLSGNMSLEWPMFCCVFFLLLYFMRFHSTCYRWLKEFPTWFVWDRHFSVIPFLFINNVTLQQLFHTIARSSYEPRQANLCLRAFRHDKF